MVDSKASGMLVWGFGSRVITHPDPGSLVFSIMSRYFNPGDDLITGGARGTDDGMEKCVKKNHGDDHVKPSIKPYPHAGGALARNVTLAKKCDRAIGIWCTASRTGRMRTETDGTSIEMNRSGTVHSIIQSMRYRKPLILCVVLPDGRYYVLDLKADLIPDGCECTFERGKS